jgi:hypothetical protein
LGEGTDCRLIEMRASASPRGLSRLNTRRPAARGPVVAICATRVDGFRSLQYAASSAVWSFLSFSQSLRPKKRPIVSGQKRPNGNNTLWRLEIRQTRKKCGNSDRFRPPGCSVSTENRPESVPAPAWGRHQNEPKTVLECLSRASQDHLHSSIFLFLAGSFFSSFFSSFLGGGAKTFVRSRGSWKASAKRVM